MDLFISIDAPDVSERMKTLSAANEPDEMRRLDQATDLARAIWKSWALQTGGSVLTEVGPMIRVQIAADYIDELPALKERYASALDSRVAIGVGTELLQADRALAAARKLGGNLALPYSEYVEEALDDKPEHPELLPVAKSQAPVAKSQAPVAMNHGAYTGAHRPASPKVEKPVPTQGEHSEAQAAYDVINDDERPPAPEGTHAAADYEAQLHEHAKAQGEKDKRESVQNNADVAATKQKIAQALQLLQAQAPVMEQLKQSSPETYQAMVGLAQSVVELARAMRGGEPMQKAEPPARRVTPTKTPARADDADIYRYVSDIHMGARADFNKVPMDTRFRLADVPLHKLPALVPHTDPRVNQYAAMNTPFPPIVIGYGGSIPDGHHRIAAARVRGDKSIRAYVPESEMGGYAVAPSKKAPKKKLKKAEFVEGKFPEMADDVEIYEYFRVMHMGGRGNLVKSVPYDTEYKLVELNVADLITGVPMDNHMAQKYASLPTPFPPIIMKTEGDQPLDGNHRVTAARIRGEKTIRAYVPLEKSRPFEQPATGYRITVDPKPVSGTALVQAHSPTGEHVGTAEFWHKDDDSLVPEQVWVHAAHRRQGIATAMYQAMQQHTGKNILPSPNQTPEGQMFRQSFDKAELEKAKLPMPEASAHSHQILPVGSRVDYKQKVQHGDGETGWVQMRAGMIMSRDGHAISSRNPKGR
jgi:GNAT superfamily N-acetyltransferase